ncbi:unnamed protein product [Strongylus vulgaris]|uniref:Uncharacterized protein n=1 Tax=Strongylus vulgaris TaxID=40348 RepID=A0A3P7M2X6_STRVU|nr:unnamed protein product [Strongylus vulgaris]
MGSLLEEAQHVLDDLDWVVVDVEEEMRLLEGVISRFAATGEGTACVLIGELRSGRTTSVKNALLKFDLDAKLQIISAGKK